MEIIHHKVQKIIVIAMLAIMIMCIATPVFAAKKIEFEDSMKVTKPDNPYVLTEKNTTGQKIWWETEQKGVITIVNGGLNRYGKTFVRFKANKEGKEYLIAKDAEKNGKEVARCLVEVKLPDSGKKENVKQPAKKDWEMSDWNWNIELPKQDFEMQDLNINTSGIGDAVGQIGQGFVNAVQGIGESGILENIFRAITDLFTRLVEMLKGIKFEIPEITIGTPVEKPVEGETEKGEIEENNQDDKDTEDVDNDEVNYIFIGDSRTVGMLTAVRNDIKKTGNIVAEYAAVGAGYDQNKGINLKNWLEDIKETLENAPKGTKVIIWLGVNDLGNVNNYINTVNSLANTYTDLNFYYVSVTPVNEEKEKKYGYTVKNSEIIAFNNEIISGLNSKVEYIDVYNTKYNTIVNGTDNDGLHYTPNTSKTIWSSIYSKL